jgi:4'-phosphopantetheinyl transferase EntD
MPSTLLAALFPTDNSAGIHAAELRQPGDPALLYPEEAAHLAKAIAKRVGEYSAGRLCARQALAQLGIDGFPLLVGADRRPQWPAGVVGSITHTHGFGGAVVARRAQCSAIGVDAEVIGRVKPALWPKVCAPREIAWLETLPEGEQERVAALIFSAKEAFYKCQYELTEGWVGFQDVSLDPAADLRGGHFAVLPLVPLKLTGLRAPPWTGRFRFEENLVVSGIGFAAA